MMQDLQQSPLVILDFGSQYTQLIARRVREMKVYCEIHPYHISQADFQRLNPCGVILSGGPESIQFSTTHKLADWLFQMNIPLLGICYGMQAIADHLGGEVGSSNVREFGYARLKIHGHSALLKNIEDETDENGHALLDVWMSHGDKVNKLPPGFQVVCSSKNAPIAAMANDSKRFYGLQFHPEVTHTKQGMRILQRFVVDICQAKTNWQSENIIAENIEQIRAKVRSEKVLLALSGGVDSSVVAALLHQAIGDQLICVFVDTGLLRLNEVSQVQTMFGQHYGINLMTIDAKEQFYQALKGVTCPEDKRKAIGRTFIDVFQDQAEKLENIQWLAQGTIYPDVIESSGDGTSAGGSKVIKSHHNVGGLPETLKLKLIEPLRTLFKDEVRQLGLNLGLPYDMVYRHPFPGPGLGVRILGEIQPIYADILRQADAIFIDELRQANLYDKVSQAFAVFLPVKSVAVMGDGRCYDYVIALRAVETTDFMTAHWSHLPWEFIGHVSNRIINEVKGVSRVVYDVSGKPPATIEWE